MLNLLQFNKIDRPEIWQSKYPSLDGFRAISISLVILFHFGIFNYGALGVDVFFIISGFLITTINLKEYSLTGTISLKNFYVRRVLRILPLLYLHLIILLILNYFFKLQIEKINILGAITFLLDFSYFRSHGFTIFTGHIWSLAVEEQFYLFMPLIFKLNYKAFVLTILFIVIILPLLCLLQSYCPAINHGIPYFFTHFLIKFQGIAVGCLLAVLFFNGHLTFKVRPWLKLLINLAAILVVFWIGFDPFYTIDAVFKNLFVTILAGFIVLNNVFPATDVLFKLLNSFIFTFIGVISYSLYMWNPLFISGDKRLPDIFNSAPANVLILIVISIASYYLFEKQFLKLKPKSKK